MNINDYINDHIGDEQIGDDDVIKVKLAFVDGVRFVLELLEEYDGAVVDRLYTSLNRHIDNVKY